MNMTTATRRIQQCCTGVCVCVRVCVCACVRACVLACVHKLTDSSDCSLYKKIDVEKVQCLNESEEGTGKTVFKPWDERLNRAKVHIHTDN